jgi:ADP-ribose pyrophosphatase YjhB (NUDIX family)
MSKKFNVRIYGILIHRNQILLSEETYGRQTFTKFPGGGLEWGEGTIDALKREFVEELNLEIEIKSHFYTTDFMQISMFNRDHQIIGIYYIVETKNVEHEIFENQTLKINNQIFKWKNYAELNVLDVSLPIDRHVVHLLKEGRLNKNQNF